MNDSRSRLLLASLAFVLAIILTVALTIVPLATGLAASSAAGRVTIARVASVHLATSRAAFPMAPSLVAPSLAAQRGADDPRLAKAYRFERGGWIYVHLEGSPHDIGYQHGYLLAPEISDAFAAVSLEMTHNSNRDWEFFRRASREMLWPKIDPEYQQELQGIVDGLQDRRVKLDLYDIVALNAFMELPDYYVPWLNDQTKEAAPPSSDGDHCSAFVATGSYTKNHQIVMAHNNWTSYLEGERWKIIFDIVPQSGYSMLMDGFPGVIVSDDDFGVNSSGLMVTETTITDFHGWDPNGKPEFVRARKAMQYAGSIDEYVKIMLDGNNGGYANDWLLADRKTNEIARFELGLKHYKVWRTRDGYFVGSNFASDPQVLKDETTFDPTNPAASANARHTRWDELMAANMGKIDATMAEGFLADHYDTYTKKIGANRRTLCGHGDVATEGDPGFAHMPYNPMGAVEGKVMDSQMAQSMSFIARIGHPCGQDFKATPFLDQHPEYRWQAPVLEDMNAGPWTAYHAGERAPDDASAPAAPSATP
ncbi:MAG: C45 family peptidase [Candidatus Acidiferrales bacterium]